MIDFQVGKVGNTDTWFLLDWLNGLSSILGLNLKLEVPSYRFLRGLSVFYLGGVFLVVNISVSRVLRGLINLLVTGSIQGLFSSLFNDKKFNPDIFSEILRVFQEDVSLSGVLLISDLLVGWGVVFGTQSLAFLNFRISFSSWRSSFFSIIIYTEINSATSPDEGALSNLLVFWINVLIKIATSHSVTVRGTLYTKVVNNLFIISRILSVRPFSSFRVIKTYLNNATVLLV